MPGWLLRSALVVWGVAVTCSLAFGERQDFPDSIFLASSSIDVILVSATKESQVIPVYARSRRKAGFSKLILKLKSVK